MGDGAPSRDPWILVLGSGQDGGTPQFGTVQRAPIARTASSIGVVDGEHRLLVDASPDLRSQWQRWVATAGVPRSASVVDGVAITHLHMGHYTGLVHFGKEAAATEAVACYATGEVLGFLQANEPWATLFRDRHLAGVPVRAGDPVSVWSGLSLAAHPVPHRREFSGTVAFSLRWEQPDWSVLYLPDIDSWPEWPDAAEVIASHDVCLLDATFYSDDELGSRDLGSVPHPLVTDTVARFAHLKQRTRLILTHLNHTNALNDGDDPAAAFVISHGFEIAHDGMVLRPHADRDRGHPGEGPFPP